jgi:hypothetical protein
MAYAEDRREVVAGALKGVSLLWRYKPAGNTRC